MILRQIFRIAGIATLFIVQSLAVCAQYPVTCAAMADAELRELFKSADSLRWTDYTDECLAELDEIANDNVLTEKQELYSELIRVQIQSKLSNRELTSLLLQSISPIVFNRYPELLLDLYFQYGNYYTLIYPIAYDSAFVYLRKAEELSSVYEVHPLYKAVILNEIGETYQYGFHDIANAQVYLDQALSIRKKHLDSVDFNLGISYYNQSVTERQNGEPMLAEAYAKRAMEIARHNKRTSFELICYNALAGAYNYQGKLDLAIKWHEDLISKGKAEGFSMDWLSFAYSNLAVALIDDEQYEYAKAINDEYLSYLKLHGYQKSDPYVRGLYQDALCTYKSGDRIAARFKYDEALAEFEDYFGEENIWNMFMKYWYAEYLMWEGELEPAILMAKEALLIVQRIWTQNQDGSALVESIIACELLGDINMKAGNPDSALYYYELGAQYLVTMKENVLLSDSKLFASDEYRPLYEKLIDASYMASLDQEGSLEAHFSWVEKNKYRVLQDRISEKARLRNQRTDSISLKLYGLNREVELLEADYQESNASEADHILLIRELKDEIRRVEQSHQSAPFADNSYVEDFAIEDLQLLLNPDELVMELFTSDSFCYILVIEEHDVLLKRFGLNQAYQDDLTRLYAVLSGAELDIYPGDYAGLSNRIFEPFEMAINSLRPLESIKELIIIPDGVFFNIPFEALVSSPQVASSFKDLDYLLNMFDISYTLSAELLASNRSADQVVISNPGILSLGPSSTAELINAEQEVERLRDNFDRVSVFRNGQRRVLLEESGTFDIIHIATHAEVDPDNYYLNRLRFGSDTEDSLVVYNYELSTLDLNASLVLLNGCESSLGESYRGEGVYSFSHSLMASGATCVLSSLWKISDQSSSMLVQLFYDKLSRGQSIGEALNTAKRDYIKAVHPDLAHPYFWAYLVGTGDSEISFKRTGLYMRYLNWLALVFLIPVTLVVRKLIQ